mmetsp:Transcript_8535/g.16133  ORF Transcript_8535/g.16133 Transcript_8535/m.16133 type:complete len:272 (+) Transcript_8535:98-913(+)
MSKIPSYGDAQYWQQRYEADAEPYDWYLRWEQLCDLMGPLLPSSAHVLILGSGTSTLSETLYAEGFANITNVDRCEAAITKMREKHIAEREAAAANMAAASAKKGGKQSPEPPEPVEARPPMNFLVAEAQALPSEWDGQFDAVIDKALLDSVACGRNMATEVAAVLRSVSRVLKPASGIYVCVSWASPALRCCSLLGRAEQSAVQHSCVLGEKKLLESDMYGWTIEHQILPRPLSGIAADPKAKEKGELAPSAAFSAEEHVYHVYICSKTT